MGNWRSPEMQCSAQGISQNRRFHGQLLGLTRATNFKRQVSGISSPRRFTWKSQYTKQQIGGSWKNNWNMKTKRLQHRQHYMVQGGHNQVNNQTFIRANGRYQPRQQSSVKNGVYKLHQQVYTKNGLYQPPPMRGSQRATSVRSQRNPRAGFAQSQSFGWGGSKPQGQVFLGTKHFHNQLSGTKADWYGWR